MQLMNLAELLYKLQYNLTALQLLFEGKWYAKLMKRIGIVDFHGLVMRAHNELVAVRGCSDKQGYPFAWDYNAFKSDLEIHRNFQDPLRKCATCKSLVRMRPTLKNIVCKKIGLKKYKNANFLHAD